MPIAGHYTYLGVEIKKNCSWLAHTNEEIGKGKAQTGRVDVILSDSHPDFRMKKYIQINADVPKLKSTRDERVENGKLVKSWKEYRRQ